MSLQRARGAFLKIAARFMGCTRSTFRIRLLSDIKVYVHYQNYHLTSIELCPAYICQELGYDTPSIPEKIWVKNVRAIVVCGFLMKSLKKHILKI